VDPRIASIEATYGVFLRPEVLALGYRDEHITAFISRREWHRVRRGAYVSGETFRLADVAHRYQLHSVAVLRQARTEVAASHASAVVLHRGPLWGLDLTRAHVTRVDGRTGRKERGVQQHRGVIADGDLIGIGPYRATSPTRCALELTTTSSAEAALCVVNDFLHRDLTTKDELAERYARMDTWPHTLSTDVVLRLADPRIESVGETRTYVMCWRAGLPRPVPQHEVYDERGALVGRVDFAWPELGVFLEFDGREKYLKHRRDGESIQDAVLREKRREELICQITGWRCIRITWADLERPDVTSARIRNLLFAANRTV
jgi:hypothetical protein